MTYDSLDRLTQTTSAMFGTASYGYDVLDNLTRVTVGASAQQPARDHYYCYDATSRQLTFIRTSSCSGAAVTTLGYDVQGNVDYKNNADYVFDYGNRLRSAPGEWYAYDGHGRRVLSCTPAACDYQQYASNGQLSFHRDNRKGLDYVNLYLGGSLVAIREQPTAGGGAVAKYQHTDALGTPIATTDSAGALIEKSEYEPYGQLVNRPLTDGPGFTGHVQDAATGLTYMQQRYYDPGIGRFLSVDPVTANSGTGMNFNRYWYANNNPYKFTDPDGRIVRYENGAGVSDADRKQHMISLVMSPTTHNELIRLEESNFTYTILVSNDTEPGYNPQTRTVRLNPSLGLKLISSDEVQSPKVNGGHEISHAAEHDRIGTKAFNKALQEIEHPDGTRSVSPEEQRASKVERQIGRELGEPTRKNYNDSKRGESVRCNPKAYSGC